MGDTAVSPAALAYRAAMGHIGGARWPQAYVAMHLAAVLGRRSSDPADWVVGRAAERRLRSYGWDRRGRRSMTALTRTGY